MTEKDDAAKLPLGSPGSIPFTLLDKAARPPDKDSPFSWTVFSWSLMTDGRDRKSLIPARDFRWVSSGIRLKVPSQIGLIVTTTGPLHDLKLDATGHMFVADELLIRVQSFRHDSVHIDNGTAIAHLQFLSKLMMELKSG